MLGPRIGRFTDKGPVEIPGHSATLQSLGTTILWFGWYGFNCGSGSPAIAGKVATITTIGAAAACITGTMVVRLMSGTYRIEAGLNCALSGLVSITAGANILEPWGAA